MIDIEE